MLPYIDLPQIHIGGLTLSIFGVTALTAVLVGSHFTLRRGEQLGIERDQFNSMLNHILLWGFVAAHLMAVLVYHPERVRRDPWVILKIWDGIASTGGIGAGAIAGWLVARRRGFSIGRVLDALAFGMAPAWIFGRLGCALVHDHPGRVTDFFLAVAYPDVPEGMGRHDLGLYEIPVALYLTVAMRWIARRPYRPGVATAAWFALYAPARFFLDFLRATDTREPDPRLFGLTPAQYIMIAVLLGSAAFLARRLRRPAEPEVAPPAAAEPARRKKKAARR